MTKYREILRLTALGLSLRDIEKSLKVSRKTVVKVQKRADELSLSWPLDESLTDAELEQRMFPKDLSPKSTKRMPDFDYIRKELLKNGVNKKLLWTEYLEECSQNGDDALMYSQFCYYIQQNEQKSRATMHIPRKAGQQIEVDWAGDPAKIIDPDTGEITEAWIFVGVMTYSQYAFVEAFINEQQKSWITAHVHMYEFFGGVTPILVSDNAPTATNRKQSVLDPGQPRTQLTNLCGIHFNSHRVIRISHIKMICRNDGVCCFIELESHRVGQKADRNDHTGNDCQNNNPERRFLIIHHRLHTIFNTNFTKGKWAGRNHATVDAADHKSLCIVGSLFVAKFLDDLFITGKLNVTAKKYISQPHQRIEPMNRQQEKTKRLPPMVFAANVRLFVGNNVLQILTIHVEREIDSRFDNAQDKRRTYILTLENVALVANSGIHFTT